MRRIQLRLQFGRVLLAFLLLPQLGGTNGLGS
jgi:hypothetical protein